MPVNPRYKAIARGARAASRLSGNPIAPFASINAVQWAVESAYGKAQSGKNNFFGIKATPAQIAAGKATKRLTHETIDGVYGPKDLYFADYASVDECFAAHTALLTDPKMGWAYKDCWAAKTAEQYAMALQEHYATGEPDHPYGVTLIAWMKRDGLFELDDAAEPAFKGSNAAPAATVVVAAGTAAVATHAATGSMTIVILAALAFVVVAVVSTIALKRKG